MSTNQSQQCLLCSGYGYRFEAVNEPHPSQKGIIEYDSYWLPCSSCNTKMYNCSKDYALNIARKKVEINNSKLELFS